MTNKRTSQAQKLTLWEMLDKYNIEIPKIQRDYAQGRKGKTNCDVLFLEIYTMHLCAERMI